MFAHLLIATDGSELAAKAESTGLALAKQLGARFTAVTASEPWSAMINGEAMRAVAKRGTQPALQLHCSECSKP